MAEIIKITKVQNATSIGQYIVDCNRSNTLLNASIPVVLGRKYTTSVHSTYGPSTGTVTTTSSQLVSAMTSREKVAEFISRNQNKVQGGVTIDRLMSYNSSRYDPRVYDPIKVNSTYILNTNERYSEKSEIKDSTVVANIKGAKRYGSTSISFITSAGQLITGVFSETPSSKKEETKSEPPKTTTTTQTTPSVLSTTTTTTSVSTQYSTASSFIGTSNSFNCYMCVYCGGVLQGSAYYLPVYPNEFSDSNSSRFSSVSIYGRSVDYQNYEGSDRSSSFTLQLHEELCSDYNYIHKLVSKFESACYPKYTNGVVYPPEVAISIGKHFYIRGVLESVGASWKAPIIDGKLVNCDLSISIKETSGPYSNSDIISKGGLRT